MSVSDQLQFQLRLKITEGVFPVMDSDNRDAIADMIGGEYSQRIQVIGTSPEILNISPNIGIRGFYVLHNYDDTNYIEWGKTGELYNKLLPNEFTIVRSNLGGDNLYAQANTAACRVEVICFED